MDTLLIDPYIRRCLAAAHRIAAASCLVRMDWNQEQRQQGWQYHTDASARLEPEPSTHG